MEFEKNEHGTCSAFSEFTYITDKEGRIGIPNNTVIELPFAID